MTAVTFTGTIDSSVLPVGPTGPQGPPGQNGTNGTNGAPGVSPTAAAVAAALAASPTFITAVAAALSPPATTPPVTPPVTPPPVTPPVVSPPTTGVARPSYNTGNGLFVKGGYIYDALGVQVVPGGVDTCHYDQTEQYTDISVNTKANIVRWCPYTQAAPTAAAAVADWQQFIGEKIFVMPSGVVSSAGVSTSGSQDQAVLTDVVNNVWVKNAALYAPVLNRHGILDVANEWGPSNSTVWRDGNIAAIASLRAAGYTGLIGIDSGGSGQDSADFETYSTAVFNSDPQKNIVFSLHVYYDYQTAAQLTTVLTALRTLANNVGMAFMIGEFGPGQNVGPSPTPITPAQVWACAQAAGMGAIGWAWDDNNAANSLSTGLWFNMKINVGQAGVASNLTAWGQEMVSLLSNTVRSADFP